MCFISESEWYADVSEEGYVFNKNEKERCDECRRPIAAGDRKFEITQQEHEHCQACENGECLCEDQGEWHDCECESPEYGETVEYVRCMDCDWFLAAVKVAELEAGCRESESLPPLGEMVNCVEESGRGEAEKYFSKAEELFPELAASGYLKWLKKKIFHDEDE